MGWATNSSTLQGSNIPSDSLTGVTQDFRFVRRMGGGGAPVQEFQEGASATWEVGDVIFLSADGQIDEAISGSDSVLGVANVAASGVAGTLIPVTLGLQDVIFEATLLSPALSAQALIGDLADLDVTASVHTVSSAASTDDLFRIVGLVTGSTDSTHINYGKVYVQIQECQLGQAVAPPT